MDDKNCKETKNIINNKIIIKEEQKVEDEKEDPNLKTLVKANMKVYKKKEDKNLSTFPALISLKNNPQKEKIEEQKDIDKKLWVPDEHAQNCYNCGSKFFSFLNRRHHCRVCGNIFCKSCLETFYEITIFEEKKELKVCSYCQEKKGELNNILKNNLVEYRNEKGNKIFETKTGDYVKNRKKEQNDIEIFCGFNNSEKSSMKEFHDNINKNYENLLEKMVYKVLKDNSDKSKFPNLEKDWGKTIFRLTKTAIDNVSPSFQDLNDSIDINEYIKIKIIEYKDQSKCEVIDGYAMQKNVYSKKMKIDIDNPKILLLKGDLSGFRGGKKENDSLIMKKSGFDDYIKIIIKKIESISPQLIIVEGNIDQKYQDFFSEHKMNISLIGGCNIKKLNKIARCVNSFVLPSPDLIGKQVILGSCSKFKVQIIKQNLKINKEQRKNIIGKEYYLMRFEGCGKFLYNTVVLTGPNREELKELKILMKTIIKTARFLYCQKFILKYFNMYYDPSDLETDKQREWSPKLKNKLRKKSTFKGNDFIYGFDTEILDENLNEFECIFMLMNNKNKNELSNGSLKSSLVTTIPTDVDINTINNISPNESSILKSVPTQCCSYSLTMKAYSTSEIEETTLGNNIFALLEDSKKKCEKCGELKSNHTSFQYKKSGRIKISIFNLDETLNNIDKVVQFLGFDVNSNKEKKKENINKKIGENDVTNKEDIYSYGFCEICNKIVTPIVKLPNEILNFSATKFYQNMIYNKKLINFGDKIKSALNLNLDSNEGNDNAGFNCRKLRHIQYRDISRLFVTRIGVIKFQYEDVVKYKLLGSQLNEKSDYYTDYYKAEKIKEIALDKTLTLNALESIKNKFLCHKSMVSDLKSENFGAQIERLKNIIEESFIIIEELNKINEQLFGNESDYENIFIYYHHLKKYLIKIMNIKIISNKLLVTIKRLLKVIFFEEVEETNKFIKEQESKDIDSSDKNDDSLNELKLLKNSIKSFNKSTIMYKNNVNDLNLSKNISSEERALSQGELKNSAKNKENGNNINIDEESLNSENNKLNNENKSSSNNSGENNTDIENNISKNNTNVVIDKNNDTTDITKENEKYISNNIKITRNLIFDLDEVNIEGTNGFIKRTKTNNKILKQLILAKFSDRDKDISINENDSSFEKEVSEGNKSKLLDLSLKRRNLSQIISNPKFKEKINAKYNECYNEIDKYIQNILELDNNGYIQSIISKLNFYDKNHNYYSNLINEEDICSIITYTLTSDKYLNSVKIDKYGLNDIKSEFVNKEVCEDGDNSLYHKTSLLYDKDNIKFTLGNLTEEKIIQILESQLLNNKIENKKCLYEVTYNPSSIFNKVFEKKKIKENKIKDSKINYSNINQKFYLLNNEIKSIKSELEAIIKEKFEDFNKKFSFTSIGNFMEEKLSPIKLEIISFYPKQFEVLRILYYASYFEFLHSIMKSQEWSSVTGGKSKAQFLKSWDEKYVVKCLDENEFKMFIGSCFHYFVHNNKYFFHKMPSSLVKVLGAYEILIKSTKKNKYYCVIMENLNYLLNPKNYNIVTYDLKGSSKNRYVKEKEKGRVLMDTNFLEDFWGEPLSLDEKIYTLLLYSISNDAKICKTMGVIDYSLLCIIVDPKNEENNNDEKDIDNENKIIFEKNNNEEKIKYIRLGVLDYFRKYTWDKQLENLGKTIINNFNSPTVVNPKIYEERFVKQISSYFIGS